MCMSVRTVCRPRRKTPAAAAASDKEDALAEEEEAAAAPSARAANVKDSVMDFVTARVRAQEQSAAVAAAAAAPFQWLPTRSGALHRHNFDAADAHVVTLAALTLERRRGLRDSAAAKEAFAAALASEAQQARRRSAAECFERAVEALAPP